MFIDYYAILEIPQSASLSEIKQAYKKQVFKWHPDRNPEIDTTNYMQWINEAYLILKDPETRKRYDIEYEYFEKTAKQKSQYNQSHNENNNKTRYEYTAKDDILNKKINKARNESINLAKQSIEDLIGMIKVGISAGTKATLQGVGCLLVLQLIAFIIYIIVYAIKKL